jgi:hypothetical protein
MVDLRKSHNFEPGQNREVPEEFYAEMGCRLILLQDLEMFIAFASKVVFAQNAQEARDAILKADNKTLGKLLDLLRKRVNIDEAFDERLKRTLRARNIFIHEFSHEFDLRTEVGIRRGIKFLLDSLDDLEEVTQVMKALIISFGRDRKIADPEFEKYWRDHGDLKELEATYLPALSKVFKEKRQS